MARTNIDILVEVVKRLGSLANELVFVGGCTTGLLISDEGAAAVRPTKDVDGIVKAYSYAQYSEFETRLERAGFRRDLEGPICRWEKDGSLLDVLPIHGDFLGFGGKWFQAAFESAEVHHLGDDLQIKVISPVYFLATKIEAFKDRGRNDFMSSPDLEDIITLLNGREELSDEVQIAAQDVREFISEAFKALLSEPRFAASLPGHLMPDTQRVGIVLERLTRLAESGS